MNNENHRAIQDDSNASATAELTADALEQCRGGQEVPAWLQELSDLMLQESIQMQRFGGIHGGSQVERAAQHANAKDGTLHLLGVPVHGG